MYALRKHDDIFIQLIHCSPKVSFRFLRNTSSSSLFLAFSSKKKRFGFNFFRFLASHNMVLAQSKLKSEVIFVKFKRRLWGRL